ncbi:MAG: tripartite tricarboxylate transporter substrate binding protein [Rhodospirillaceae bacterium]|nr:tripartite tricarboxylate transporter substrate binding protein [Rhodospirillaceae bacterium]
MPAFTRRYLLGTATLAALAPTSAAFAQAYPSRPIRFIVPFAAGAGVLDIMARLVGQHLGQNVGQQVMIDNRPGAGGNVGAEVAAKATPDGYTLLMGAVALVVSPYLYARLPFDPLTDLVPVTQVNSAPLMLVVHPSLPVTSVAELIAYAKARPGQLNYGSGGVGATPFLATELFKSMAGIDVVHVPYKGGAPALADLVAGQLSFMIENVPGTLPLVRDGKLRALAITSRQRLALVPELPTMEEAGVPGYEMIGWNGIFVPKVTPAEIVTRLNAELVKVVRSAEVGEQLARLGAVPVGDTPQQFGTFVKAESARWGRIIKDLGIKPE